MFRTKKFFVIYSCICIFSSSTVIAQLKIDADIRPRFEYRHGFGNLFPDNAEPAVFVQQRTRLNIGYSINKIAIGLSVQDVSVWGDTPQISTSDLNDSFALFQAWISYQFNEYWSTKLGRQVLSYDDQRILGGLDWAQQGRFHDAALIRYNKDSFKIDLGCNNKIGRRGLSRQVSRSRVAGAGRDGKRSRKLEQIPIRLVPRKALRSIRPYLAQW